MNGPHFRRKSCRLCGGSELECVLSLQPTPPANAFVPKRLVGQRQPTYPLDVFLCRACGHVQLLDVVDARELFEQYVYVSGTSPVFVRHFENYAQSLISQFSPPSDSLVIDIGSNDGTLLGFFRDQGHSVLGVDPARAIAEKATMAGIETLPQFFTPELAREIRASRGLASMVTANNVFAHADDLGGIVEGVEHLLAPGGVFAFEVSYLLDVFEKTLFDTIYHEHLAYHTVRPLRSFFQARGMELVEAVRIDTHGGSIRGLVQRSEDVSAVGDSVATAAEVERVLRLDQPEPYAEFAGRIAERKRTLSELLGKVRASGKHIAAFGAPAKATTLLYEFGLGPDIIDFVVDDSPLKQGLFTPGMHIPVFDRSALKERRPDYLVILAWNFVAPIVKSLSEYREDGGKVIVPLPDLEIL